MSLKTRLTSFLVVLSLLFLPCACMEALRVEEPWVIEEIDIDENGKNIYGQIYFPKDVEAPYPLVILAHGYNGTLAKMAPYARPSPNEASPPASSTSSAAARAAAATGT